MYIFIFGHDIICIVACEHIIETEDHHVRGFFIRNNCRAIVIMVS